MSKKTTCFIGILATLILGFLLHWYFCCDEHCTENQIEKTKQTNANAATPFKFEDGNTAIRSIDNFNFYFSGHAIMEPISEDLLSCVKEMIRHLEKNKSKTLNILGLYNEREENLSNFDNLGLARAESIKRVLIEQGLDAAQVSTASKKDNSLTPNQEGVLNGPYAFSVEVLEGSNSLEAMKASIMEDPVLLNFAPERYRTDLNAKQRKKLEALAAYLNASDDAHCTIVGHADSVKSEQLNLILGKNRAEFTKTMLLKYDVDPVKIKTISKGETQPIASNTTAKGKAQNRRTEVIIN